MTFPYDWAKLQALQDDVAARGITLQQSVQEAAQAQPRASGLSEKDIAEIERYARTSGAPKELRELQRRVESGDLSWKDIAAGKALADPGVQAAMRTGMPDLKRAYTAIQEGGNIDEIIASGQPRARRSRGEFDDDEPSDFTEDAF